MAIHFKPSKFAKVITEPSLTEQEHKDSCDINKMIAAARRGQQVRGGPPPVYGYDDTTMDGITHRIMKDELEKALAEGEKELPEEALNLIPPGIIKKFGLKAKPKSEPKSEAKNDDKTTKNAEAKKASKKGEAESKAEISAVDE